MSTLRAILKALIMGWPPPTPQPKERHDNSQ